MKGRCKLSLESVCVRKLSLCRLDPELAGEKETRRLFALVLIVGISREDTKSPQVGRDEVVLNYC